VGASEPPTANRESEREEECDSLSSVPERLLPPSLAAVRLVLAWLVLLFSDSSPFSLTEAVAPSAFSISSSRSFWRLLRLLRLSAFFALCADLEEEEAFLSPFLFFSFPPLPRFSSLSDTFGGGGGAPWCEEPNPAFESNRIESISTISQNSKIQISNLYKISKFFCDGWGEDEF